MRLQVERNVMFLILTLIVLVAALNIVSGLIMLVKDKGSDIAILRTMGATQGAIMRIFLITGASIGVVGTLVGLPARHRRSASTSSSIRHFLSWLTNTELFSPELYFLSQLPADMNLARNHRGRGDGARTVAAGDALSVLAGGAARSGRSAALRVIRRDGRENRDTETAAPAAPGEEQRPFVFLHAISRNFRQGDATLDILQGAELAVWPGQSVALVAPSGAGKSTLLHIAGLLEHPDAGEVYIDGVATTHLSDIAAHPYPPHRHRLRLSVPSSAAGIFRGGERDAAADDPRPVAQGGERRARPNC